MNFFPREVASPEYLCVQLPHKLHEGEKEMKHICKAIAVSALVLAGPAALAGEKDCLLKGTVEHGAGGAEGATQVNIHSISRYDEDSRCSVRRGQKMEFKLPQDSRVQDAPSGSEVEYRYRTDDTGEANAELIRVGA